MLLEYFRQYIKVTRNITDKSVGHYITGLNSINSLLAKYDYKIKNVFDVNCVEDLDGILTFLMNNDEFRLKDSTGHNMYSVAFKHFYSFATADNLLFSKNIEAMDMMLDIPQKATSTTISWQRNQILISQAIEGANYLCENDHDHVTFTSKATGKSYMEGHHLIPLRYQPEFLCSIDVYANIVCLCPICHRLLHYGANNERIYATEKLFDERHIRLKKSGIDITRKDFLKLVI